MTKHHSVDTNKMIPPNRQSEWVEMPNPTKKDLQDPLFNEIWEVIKNWDVNVPKYYGGYCGANGSHVMLLLQPIRKLLKAHTSTIIERLSAKKQPVTYKKDNGHGWAVPMSEILLIQEIKKI